MPGEGQESEVSTAEEAVNQCLDSMVRVLKFSSVFSKRDRKNLRKILRKLPEEDLIYLANLFDDLYEELVAKLGGNEASQS